MDQTELVYKSTEGLAPFAYVVVDQWLYFCDQIWPALFRYNFETEKCECVIKFEKDCIHDNFFKILAHENELWLLPFLDGKIICFHMDSNIIDYYDISPNIEEKAIPFMDMFFSEKEAYIAPHGNNRYIIRVDLMTHDMQEIKLVEETQYDNVLFFSGAIQFGKQIYLAETSLNILLVFNIDNCNIKIIYINEYSLKDLALKGIKNKIYFFPIYINGNERLLVYDVNTNSCIEKEFSIKNLPYGDVCIALAFDDNIWVLANKKKRIYQMNLKLEIESEISILNFNEEEKMIYVSGFSFSDRFFWNGCIGTSLIQVKDNMIQILDVNKDKNILGMYIDMIGKSSRGRIESKELDTGRLIYESINER